MKTLPSLNQLVKSQMKNILSLACFPSTQIASQSLRLLLCLVIFGYSFQCMGQIDSIYLTANWSVGDAYDFQVTKTTLSQGRPGRTTPDTQTYLAHFKVIDSTDAGYIIRWRTGRDLDRLGLNEKQLEDMADLRWTDVIYSTTPSGEFRHIENWQAVRYETKRFFTKLAKMTPGADQVDESNIQRIVAPRMRGYQSRESMEKGIFRELTVFHAPFGTTYVMGDPQIVNDTPMELMPGRTMQADIYVYLDSIDVSTGLCSIRQEMTVDGDDLRENVLGSKNSKKLRAEAKKALTRSEMTLKDRNLFQHYFRSGTPKRIEASREVGVTVDRRKTVTTLEVLIELIE